MNEQIKRRPVKARVRLVRLNGQPTWEATVTGAPNSVRGSTPLRALIGLKQRLEEYP